MKSVSRPRGQARRLLSGLGPALPVLLVGIIYRTGRHSCQAEAGGAGDRTVPFAVTKLQGSLLCMCQAFGADP